MDEKKVDKTLMLQLEIKRLEDEVKTLRKAELEHLRDKFDLLCEIERLNFELKKVKGEA